MNGLFNNNFLIGMLLAKDLPRQEQFIAGLVAGQMPANSPIGPLLLQPLVSRLATEEKGRTSAESNAVSLQQPLEVELPAGAETARVGVPGATASFSRISGSEGTTIDSGTGVITLPNAHGEEKIAIAVNGSAREITILRGPRATTGQAATKTLTEAQLADFGRAFLTALQSAARNAGGVIAADAPVLADAAPIIADRPPRAASAKDRSGQRGSGYAHPETAAESTSAAT
jgi:hypothetical protein